jgi:hypothetical protein
METFTTDNTISPLTTEQLRTYTDAIRTGMEKSSVFNLGIISEKRPRGMWKLADIHIISNGYLVEAEGSEGNEKVLIYAADAEGLAAAIVSIKAQGRIGIKP